MFQTANVCYVSILVVGTEEVVTDLDVNLAAVAALKVTMLVCLSVHNEFHDFSMPVCMDRLYIRDWAIHKTLQGQPGLSHSIGSKQGDPKEYDWPSTTPNFHNTLFTV